MWKNYSVGFVSGLQVFYKPNDDVVVNNEIQ